MAAILLTESSARSGTIIGDKNFHKDPSLGPFQVRASTVVSLVHLPIEVGSRNFKVLQRSLLEDTTFNYQVALIYYLHLRSKLSYKESIAAYNLGVPHFRAAVKKGYHPTRWHYTQTVLKYEKILRKN